MRKLIVLTVLALAACQQPEPAEKAAPAPAATIGPGDLGKAPPSAITDFSQPMTARGNEPFWAVKMEGTQLTLTRPEHPEAVFEAPGAQVTPGRGIWEAKAADGRTMKLTLYVSPCSDGMSDLTYPMTAEVELLGETLRGCAAKTAALPKGAG